MKKLNDMLTICIASFMGGVIGKCIYRTIYYYNNLDFYMIHSEPWYKGIPTYGCYTLILVSICFSIKYIIRKKINRSK